MLLLVGLGNPGAEYAGHRHNVGFMAIDAIARRHGFTLPRSRFQGMVAEATIGPEKVLVLKPVTFMNESGRAVGEAARFYKLAPADIVVFHDEIDLAAGKVRIKTGGGHAGHNGLRSIDAHLKSRDYRRVRIGVEHPGERDRVHRHVLSDFARADQFWLEPLLVAMADELPLLIGGDDKAYMSRLAQPGSGGARKSSNGDDSGTKPAQRGSGKVPDQRTLAAAQAERNAAREVDNIADNKTGDNARGAATALGAALRRAFRRLGGN